MSDKPPLPPSRSSFRVNLCGAIAFLLCVLVLHGAFQDHLLYLALTGVSVTFAVLLAGEIFYLKSYARERVGWAKDAKTSWGRMGIKLLSFNVTLLLVWLGYSFIPEYDHAIYRDFESLLPLCFPAAVIVGNLYIAVFDTRLGSPDDALLHFGYMLCGRWKAANSQKIIEHLRGVMLRAYFMPAMVIYLTGSLDTIFMNPEEYLHQNTGQDGNANVVEVLKIWLPAYFFIMAVDGLFAVIGYLSTFRALDTDVRSTESTVTGWISCLVCYTPFFEVLLVPLVLRDFYYNPEWFVWFADHRALLIGWGGLAAIAMVAEASGTMTFGLRFSNLTYRGLISTGLFRYTKHPQYVSKMINRFCVYVPFLSLGGALSAAWTMALFAAICLLYYVRARTEENHLSHYPEYVEYAEAMNERSVFRCAAKLLPFLKYNEEKARAGKLF